jgi:hypothetical protein
MVDQPESTTFCETQRFRQWWIWLIVLGVAAFAWYGFIQQVLLGQLFGTNPAPDWAVWLIWLAFGIGFPAFFYSIRLIVAVGTDHLLIQYIPFFSRSIPFQEIERFEARTYRPIREYGGWGLRWAGTQKRAYNVSGNQGVEVFLRDDHQIMLGSQRAQELATALGEGIKKSRTGVSGSGGF